MHEAAAHPPTQARRHLPLLASPAPGFLAHMEAMAAMTRAGECPLPPPPRTPQDRSCAAAGVDTRGVSLTFFVPGASARSRCVLLRMSLDGQGARLDCVCFHEQEGSAEA
jgi:hypothetical protein